MRRALTFFYEALVLDSTFLDPRFYIVFAHLNLGEPAAADSNAQLLARHRPRMTEYQRSTLDWQLAFIRGDRTAALEAARARGGLDVGVEALRANRPQEAVDALSNATGLSDWYFHWLTLMEAYHALGDYRRELEEARRGREVYPERLRMLDAEVRALAALGRFDEMNQRIEESLLLSPDDGLRPIDVMLNAAEELRAHGFTRESFEAADRAIRWHRSRPPEEVAFWGHRFSLARAYYVRESWDSAAALFEGVAAEGPGREAAQPHLGALAARRGDREAALAIEALLSDRGTRGSFALDTYNRARIAALLGDRERAVGLLQEAYARGYPFMVLMHRDMDLEPLRDYPPFQQFMKPKG
jgi:tetratricopeptide (TPR) repeat protein